MSGNMHNFDQNSRNKELLNNLVESQARQRIYDNQTKGISPREPETPHVDPQNNVHQPSAHAMVTQTSQPWLPPNQTQIFRPNILKDPNVQSHMAKRKIKGNNWKSRFQKVIDASNQNPKILRQEIINLDVREAKLRDQRDRQAKKLYEFATVDYFLVPELANMFGELSRNQANVSNHHEALLNRVDARTCQELELMPDMGQQIKTQLDVYCKARADFDDEMRRNQMGRNSGSWLGFFQPSSPRYPQYGFGGAGMMMQGNGYQAPGYASPERAPSELNVLAKKCKEALQDLEEIVQRYYTANFEHIKKAMQMMAKAYIEYHTHCLEIFTKEWNDIDEFQPEKACTTCIESLGLPDMKQEVETHIAQTSNTGMYHQMEMTNSMQNAQQRTPWNQQNYSPHQNSSPWQMHNQMGFNSNYQQPQQQSQFNNMNQFR